MSNKNYHHRLSNQIRKIILTLLLLPFATAAKAQFIELPATAYPITQEELPVYSHMVKLTDASAGREYTINLLYPEYVPLTKKEQQLIEKYHAHIADTIIPQTTLGFSRRVGYLEYAFTPIVRKGKQWVRLTSAKVEIKPITTYATAPKQQTKEVRWKQESVLAHGKWVKIRVKEEGIYALTNSFLQKAGFNHPEKVKLYGYGGRMIEEDWTFDGERRNPDDLEEIPLFRRDDNTMLFFAEGTTRWTWHAQKAKWIHQNNPYSRYSYYFLTEGEQPLAFDTQASTKQPTTKDVTTVAHHAVVDNDAFGWYHGGREMYDEHDFAYGNQKTYKISTPHATSGEAIIDIAFSAASMSSTTSANITLNGEKLGSLSVNKYGESQNAYETRRSFTVEDHHTDENHVSITTNSNNPARLNFIRVNYTRTLDAGDAPFSFSPNKKNPIELKVKNANSGTQLWQINFSGSPTCAIKSTLSGDILTANIDYPQRRFVIVNTLGNYPTPEIAGEVANQNLHADSNIDMVIIMPKSRLWQEEAEQLAEAHREKQQLNVKIVDAEELYNEFSSGTPDASAYRRYLKMLYDRAETAEQLPRYLLLFGDCVWDNRMLTPDWKNASPDNYLLAFEVSDGFNNENSTSFPIGEISSYITDDFYGWLDDSEGSNYSKNKLDISIGRLPCHDKATAKVMVEKTIAYLNNENTGNWKNLVYSLADYGNENLHMNDAKPVIEQIDESTQGRIEIKRIYWDAYERETSGTGYTFPAVTRIVQQAMKEGALIFNYTGHGSPQQISHARIVTTQDFETPAKGNLPLWIMASCEISPYDSDEHDIGRAALHNPTGGAVAVICASRSVYSNYNKELNIILNKHLFHLNEDGKYATMGEALCQTKVELLGTATSGVKDGSINKLKYVLLGDPALTLQAPTAQVVVDSINGVSTKPTDDITLNAESIVRFSGRIVLHNGQPADNFDGVITGKIKDRMETITCHSYNNRHADPFVYSEHTKTVYEGTDSIRNGRFTFTARIPRSISYSDEKACISFYAVSENNEVEANGFYNNFHLNGTDPSASADTIAPKVFVYLNTPDFPNGGIVADNAVLIAEISDNVGINATDISIGQEMELVIDKEYSAPKSMMEYFKYNFGSYQEGTITYPLESLTPGRHHLQLKIWDISGNSTTCPLDFYVNAEFTDQFDVYATQNPASSSTNFVCTFNNEGEENSMVTFRVYDVYGRLVWQKVIDNNTTGNNTALTTWHLNNTGGARVNPGIYLYQAEVRNGQGSRTTDAKKIIIVGQ